MVVPSIIAPLYGVYNEPWRLSVYRGAAFQRRMFFVTSNRFCPIAQRFESSFCH